MTIAKKANHELDLTSGKIMSKLIIYAIPFIFANILQILFNTADIIVLGAFVGDDAVAAVGANTALTGLVVNMFIAFSTGSSVVLARYVGARDLEGARNTIGTSIFIAVVSGFILTIIGVSLADVFLEVMGCDPEIRSMAATYLRIYFLGMPITMLYNFCASILRAVGDTKRPLIFLAIGGVVNVALNVFFVTVCGMTVEGVAIATVVSQAISTTLSLIVLFKGTGYGCLKLKKIKIFKKQFVEIVKIAIPSALQSLAFNISNVLIQSSINAFGKEATAGSAAATQFDAVIYNIGHAVALSCMSFVSQNMGAKRMDRVKKSITSSLFLCTVLTFGAGFLFYLLRYFLCGLVVDGPQQLEYATTRLTIMCLFYFLCCDMDVLSFSVRSLGKPTTAMVVSIIGAVGVRILALEVLKLIFPGVFGALFFAYVICWLFTIGLYCFVLPRVYKQAKKQVEGERQEEQPATEN